MRFAAPATVAIVRKIAVALSLAAGVVLFLVQLDQHYKIRDWLFFRYAGYLALCAVFTLACASAGHRVISRWLPDIPAREHGVYAMTAGLLLFFLVMFVGGILHLYGRAFWAAAPLALLASGWTAGPRSLFRFLRACGAVRRTRPPSALVMVAWLFGLGGLAMVYFSILTPDNAAFDSRWYHMPLAEHYVALGGVEKSPEGWYQASLPHLASFIYAWAFMMPIGSLFDKVELCAHLEFTIFIWTLASIPALVRWLVTPSERDPAGRRAGRATNLSGTWAALFLFPGIFLYDSSLTIASDHVLAFFTVPIFLAYARVLRDPTPRYAAWLAVPLSGAVLTKYQAAMTVVFVAATLTVWCAFVAVRRSRKKEAGSGEPLLALAAVAGTSLVLTAPHFLKNFIYYGDPAYPFLYKHLQGHPWNPDAAVLFEEVFKGRQLWAPTGTSAEKATATLKALFTFSFVPNDWVTFHGKVPVFGSLFTLSLGPLLFLRHTRRTWLLVLAVECGIGTWYANSHQDRYLQNLVPWMAAVVAAMLHLAWRAGVLARLAASLLVATQVVWGGDVYFLPTHAMLGQAPAKRVMDLIASGYTKNITSRRASFRPFSEVAEHLKKTSKVLVHERLDHLGLGTASVSDIGPWVGGINWGREKSPLTLYEHMSNYGVTHFLYNGSTSFLNDSLAGDLAFLGFMIRYARDPHTYDEMILREMPMTAPPDEPWLDERVAVFVCAEAYEPGIYRLGDLTVETVGEKHFPKPLEPVASAAQAASAMPRVDFVALDVSCHSGFPNPPDHEFTRTTMRLGETLYVRHRH